MKIGFDLMDGIDTPKIGRVFAMLEKTVSTYVGICHRTDRGLHHYERCITVKPSVICLGSDICELILQSCQLPSFPAPLLSMR